MRIALSEMLVEGIKTNIPLHQELMLDARFVEGGTSIHYLEHKLAGRNEVSKTDVDLRHLSVADATRAGSLPKRSWSTAPCRSASTTPTPAPTRKAQFGRAGHAPASLWDHNRVVALFDTDTDPALAWQPPRLRPASAPCRKMFTIAEVEEQN